MAVVCTTCSYHPFTAHPIHFFPVTADYEQTLSSINKALTQKSLPFSYMFVLPAICCFDLSIPHLTQGSTFTEQVQ